MINLPVEYDFDFERIRFAKTKNGEDIWVSFKHGIGRHKPRMQLFWLESPFRKVHASEEVIGKVKGSVLVPLGANRPLTCHDDWQLTAEHSSTNGISDLTFEWIINGLNVKLKSGRDHLVLPGVWDDMANNIENLNPHVGDTFGITTVDSSRYGEWTLTAPITFSFSAFFPGIQVTKSIPMSGIYDIIKNSEGSHTNVLVPLLRRRTQNLVLITSEDLREHYTDDTNMTDSLLGFFSLLMSWVNTGTKLRNDGGPKQLIHIMPRTDFAKLYDLYGKDDEGSSGGNDLAEKKGISDVAHATFKWAKDTPVKNVFNRYIGTSVPGPNEKCTGEEIERRPGAVDTSVDWITKGSDIEKRELDVESWVRNIEQNGYDLLAIMDTLVWDGQIGGFGDRTEGPLSDDTPEDELPLYEIRDLSPTNDNRDGVKKCLINIEKQLKAYLEPSSQGVGRRALFCKVSDSTDSRCEGIQVPNPQGKCEDCGRGFKPNAGNKMCVPENPGEDERKKGKCKDKDFILDPAQGGQDENTENPLCTYDDEIKCKAKEQSAVTRSPKNIVQPKDADIYEPQCGKNNDPNFKCKADDTYHHKAIDDDDNIKHSCRATRDAKNKQRNKYNDRVNSAKEEKEKTKEQRKMKDGNKAGVDAWAMPADDLNGMMELWPDTNDLKDAEPVWIADYKTAVTPPPTIPVDNVSVAGGFGGWLIGIGNAISRAIAPISKVAGSSSRVFTSLRSGLQPKAAQAAVQGAKVSQMVQKILKDERFLQCLSATPALVGDAIAKTVSIASTPRNGTQHGNSTWHGDAPLYMNNTRRQATGIIAIEVAHGHISFNESATYYDPKIPPPDFDGRQIVVSGMIDTFNIITNSDGVQPFAATYPDKIRRPGRLDYENCQQLPDPFLKTLTGVGVEGGCFGWYSDVDCKTDSFLFAMTNRSDNQLDGGDNDATQAIWCTFDDLCKGAPGPPDH
ncbi:hypothetical protein K491DRAFT_717366 [Lophiostoma macrostomum CBS 122681]|uniref:Uncharacterized protein n=1 Tax=Lophiostoma macrostomum CBS 122681 TaxID=1314788 RepID=A0A6A6T6L7_9PLEO|nr:hypothetical protein K491DRAFT_717366 [Lophiostoma macrostomum CBS 122681]